MNTALALTPAIDVMDLLEETAPSALVPIATPVVTEVAVTTSPIPAYKGLRGKNPLFGAIDEVIWFSATEVAIRQREQDVLNQRLYISELMAEVMRQRLQRPGFARSFLGVSSTSQRNETPQHDVQQVD